METAHFTALLSLAPGKARLTRHLNRDKNAKLLTLEPHNACFYFCFPPMARTSSKGCLTSTKLSTA